jgi:hypothetical protein
MGALGGGENLWPYGIYLKGNPGCVVTISSEFLSCLRGEVFPLALSVILQRGQVKWLSPILIIRLRHLRQVIEVVNRTLPLHFLSEIDTSG